MSDCGALAGRASARDADPGRTSTGPPADDTPAVGAPPDDAPAVGEAEPVPGERAACARSVPVQRMRPGDHAFTTYGSESDQWDVLGAFIRQGLIEDERVLVLLVSGLVSALSAPELLSRMGARTPATEEACRSGRLTFGSMRELIRPDTEFTSERQWQRLREETDRAVGQGYPAVRAYIDMAWVADLDADVAAVMRRERRAGHLFAQRRYSEICAYDERVFPAAILDSMAEAHPRTVLGRLGSLHASHSAHMVRLIGEADVTTSAAFGHALRTAVTRTAAAGLRRLTVDLTPLHFLGAGCAADLLRLCAGAAEDRVGVTVRCSPFQARTLERLGARAVPSLALDPSGPAVRHPRRADVPGAEGTGC